jgi:CelD/BcsL family acetyltransferase involved in cellulose biosynthesis
LLAARGREDEVAREACEWLCGEAGDIWDLVELSGLEASDPTIAALTKHFAIRGHTIHRRPGMNCWRVELAPTWDQFLESVHSSRRAKIRQSLRKFIDNGKVVSHVVADLSGFDRAFATLIDLHQRRQRSLGRPGCFSSKQFTEFHLEVGRRFLATGKLQLMWAEMAGRPIAASYSFVGGRTVYYYQTGLDPDSTKVAPGWLGMIASLRTAIEAGCSRFDFLRGDESYKSSWDAQARPTIEIRIAGNGRIASFRDAAWRAQARVRGWIKRGIHFGRRIAKQT